MRSKLLFHNQRCSHSARQLESGSYRSSNIKKSPYLDPEHSPAFDPQTILEHNPKLKRSGIQILVFKQKIWVDSLPVPYRIEVPIRYQFGPDSVLDSAFMVQESSYKSHFSTGVRFRFHCGSDVNSDPNSGRNSISLLHGARLISFRIRFKK